MFRVVTWEARVQLTAPNQAEQGSEVGSPIPPVRAPTTGLLAIMVGEGGREGVSLSLSLLVKYIFLKKQGAYQHINVLH